VHGQFGDFLALRDDADEVATVTTATMPGRWAIEPRSTPIRLVPT
jgi:hypothetical protein